MSVMMIGQTVKDESLDVVGSYNLFGVQREEPAVS
jgi:hypothetical protein